MHPHEGHVLLHASHTGINFAETMRFALRCQEWIIAANRVLAKLDAHAPVVFRGGFEFFPPGTPEKGPGMDIGNMLRQTGDAHRTLVSMPEAARPFFDYVANPQNQKTLKVLCDKQLMMTAHVMAWGRPVRTSVEPEVLAERKVKVEDLMLLAIVWGYDSPNQSVHARRARWMGRHDHLEGALDLRKKIGAMQYFEGGWVPRTLWPAWLDTPRPVPWPDP